MQYFEEQDETLESVRGLLNNTKEPAKAIENLQEENNELKKQLESLLAEKAKNVKGELKADLEEINGIQFLAREVDLDANGIKDLSFHELF